MLASDLISATPSKAIDAIYAEDVASNVPGYQTSLSESPASDVQEERLLLKPQSARTIAGAFALPGLQVEIERAIEQVRQAIGSRNVTVDGKKEALPA